MSQEKRGYLAESLARALADKDPAMAMDGIAAFPDNLALLKQGWVEDCFKDWALNETHAALAWIDQLQRSPRFAEFLAPTISPSHADQHAKLLLGLSLPLLNLQSALFGILMQSDLSAARAYLEGFPAETSRINLVHDAISDDADANRALDYLQVIRDLIPEKSREPMLAELVTWNLRFESDLGRVEPLLQEGLLDIKERQVVTRTAAITFYTSQHQTLPRDPDLDSYFDEWLARVAPDDAAAIGATARAEAAERESFQAESTIRGLRNSDSTDDYLAHILTSMPMGSHLEEALELAGKIKDPIKREKIVK
jgi:hypothetical protein